MSRADPQTTTIDYDKSNDNDDEYYDGRRMSSLRLGSDDGTIATIDADDDYDDYGYDEEKDKYKDEDEVNVDEVNGDVLQWRSTTRNVAALNLTGYNW